MRWRKYSYILCVCVCLCIGCVYMCVCMYSATLYSHSYPLLSILTIRSYSSFRLLSFLPSVLLFSAPLLLSAFLLLFTTSSSILSVSYYTWPPSFLSFIISFFYSSFLHSLIFLCVPNRTRDHSHLSTWRCDWSISLSHVPS